MDGYGYYMTNRAGASSTSPAAADPGQLAQLLANGEGHIGREQLSIEIASFKTLASLNFGETS